MILETMLQRLYASLTSGPGLNARPHGSRQRIDLHDFRHLQGTDPAAGFLAQLLSAAGKSIEFPARTPAFKKPDYPESEWSDEQKDARAAAERQTRVLNKTREIAADAVDYYNDYGEQALYIGFPLLSIPARDENHGSRARSRGARILAPLALVPVNLTVRRDTRPGISISTSGNGADLVQPNPALMAWIEQKTGADTDELFADDNAEAPWREITDIINLVAKAAGIPLPQPGAQTPPPPALFDAATPLQPVPKTDALPDAPAILPCAVLGLFPVTNPGLLRDTQWMIENEPALDNPIRPFLTPEALVETDPDHHAAEAAAEAIRDHAQLPARDFSNELLVTHADPCQAEAVLHARNSAALVIHGPPGTGKSQTIANVIGDHLARGEKVLFVCDKRTALDVVKYRLDGMGLGPLCGVIHDPQRDRRDLYLGLRERLENLAQDQLHPNPAPELDRINTRLNKLHAELRENFDSLHATADGCASFHDTCGKWLELAGAVATPIPAVDGLTPALIEEHRVDLEEGVQRALAARWPENPFRNRVGISLADWLAKPAAATAAQLRDLVSKSSILDRYPDSPAAPLSAGIALDEQVGARVELAARLDAAIAHARHATAARLAADPHWQNWRAEIETLAPEKEPLAKPLDRELHLQTKGALPALAQCNQRLLALREWLPLADSWKRHFAFSKKSAARRALEPLALPLDRASAERAQTYYAALKARHLWADVHERIHAAQPADALPPDETLRALADALPSILDALEAASLPANSHLKSAALSALGEPATSANFPALLRQGAQRASALIDLRDTLAATKLFHAAAIDELIDAWRSNPAVTVETQRFVEFQNTLEECVRYTDVISRLSPALSIALTHAADAALPWETAEPALRLSALTLEIQTQLRENPALARIDTHRVEAAFSEKLERTAEKASLVRQLILYRWQKVWRDRLLAATGGRLNTLGASLRQRLFVRGQRAMKLRQMIAAGADIPGGDPLFDFCPVWMAGPSTVAQIFPRAHLFDVIIFDEASQCRLEEALPVLLRGKRVVIAGDPKQLPPTRFFESALTESNDTAAETAEEVFAQQQSETEDLLGAALNLNVQEAFLDVHYRSRNAALIGFSNDSFYNKRLQPIPGHPKNRAVHAPILLTHVDGVYHERGNEAEARAAANLVAELLDTAEPPSIGVACFNLNQRDLIIDALDEKAAADPAFAQKLETARRRRGRDSFEGLFVKNLENVQGDERDHMIICTTFGPDKDGKFRRNFGALSRIGGDRRLNVLVTRARDAIHVLTSIPRVEYTSVTPPEPGRSITGRHQLYAYLRYAETLGARFDEWQTELETARRHEHAQVLRDETTQPSALAEALARRLHAASNIGSTVYWGNDGFCVDIALTHPHMPADVTIGVLTDFNRYKKTPDPVAWENFRAQILQSQGWSLHRIWSPALFRDPEKLLAEIADRHQAATEQNQS
ncbi:hypothetical protein M2103_000208 [Ereboglobus sp. PH5-5]|uniref:AAA domain-containing protein n=1 Tax=Ereboglobus sp. PH5-5 TaxID=2940529 RepID=UPI0024052A0F|nr:AAA domain-containing protein [Ereboglobus sp. PH5-5]MDF9832004.1 hypothetical protein [Ereboglobus sp. PH5-5]